MGRGISSGGGQSSGYLFGDGQAPKPASGNAKAGRSAVSKEPLPTPNAASQPIDISKQVPAGIHSRTSNHVRADGQSACNFITDRPSTKVHAAPGGGSSLDYLFGGGSK
ncbi:Protein SPIRAL1-like 1 [Orobanche hederae]